ncbi:ABC transporter permease [Meiothermus ruber]|jgi:spermidine/putrescine transport system permease protein|uniref:Binding-protein-dependent transport system inner membrane protein n=1 Tax=Meiothermus ruber (strain ATCC 35948 / DSM 1279 / VKM B-1258 / 21) TaxID=504728 RepID=D3PTA2_MEIRD|nr:ABC transporter permease [Meiothermus ruber]ADD28685.1 binding-protein-dependent transport systems inner membrane component [Meiothermus ruber DSM 1279]AGK05870.1 binding-protein-dependent transport system inner membrane protein [Meiothermus ruber DSM 1279]MCL6530990.1 ABC transporter permease [Meiothermus ruber]MCX7801818.1 ABC transporter permease [Meiothermus ruber]GAO75645.1 binding-protein-dependent transport system inner membrane protein [Meiothermus ruber H328]
MKRWLAVHAWLVFAFLYLPIAVIVALSFNQSRFGVRFTGFTFDWYIRLFNNERILEYLTNTLIVAVVSTAVSTILGTLLAVGLVRYRFRWQNALRYLLYVPVVVPDVVMGISLLLLFDVVRDAIGWPRLSLFTIILAHISFQIAYVTLVVRARLMLLDPTLEEAAKDLGATPWLTFREVTLPLIMPGVISGALLAFSLSLDDFVVTFFTAGPGSTTLPLYIYSSVKLGISPEIHALSTLMVGITILVLLLGTLFWKQRA